MAKSSTTYGALLAVGTALALAPAAFAGEKTFDVDSFHEISASGAGDLVVTVGEAQSVTIEAKDKHLDKIEVTVDDGRLEIRSKSRSWFGNSGSYKAVITVPSLDYLGLSGATEAVVTGVEAEDFEYRASGASETEISGTCVNLSIKVSGASELDAKDLVCQNADVRGSGASEIEVHATETLSVSASGATDIDVYGGPKTNKMSTSGASDVDYKDS